MRITLDRVACTGHGLCRDIAPTVFRIGEDGLAELLTEEVAPALARDVAEAVKCCPDNAIAIVERAA